MSKLSERIANMYKKLRTLITRQLLVSTLIFLFLILLTSLVILYGKGYRIGIAQGEPKLSKTGILSATSTPPGASVYINGHPTTATNNTINLIPGKYTVVISKDGYNSWQKDIEIKQQDVSYANATLFPSAPSLQSISSVGVQDPVLDPSGTKLAFTIASQSAVAKNGIYVLDMTSRSFPVLPMQSSSTQIVSDTIDAFSTAQLFWSPDGQQIIASISGQLGSTYYLLNATGLNSTPQDVTTILPTVLDNWKTEKLQRDQARMQSLKPVLQKMINDDFSILSWSPDDTKILYQASQSATLPIVITPRRIGNNLLYEQRTLQKGSIYVYDLQEDVNTRITENPQGICDPNDQYCIEPLHWFPDSYHLVYVHNKKITVVEDDGANSTTIYAGPFVIPYVYPWADGSKIVILTNLGNPAMPPTLYTISLRSS